jgi:hypothetical protein
MEHVIIAEPIGPGHERLIQEWGIDTRRLPGRIRFPHAPDPPPLPAGLVNKMKTGRLWLVVHSGPEHELHRLIRHVRESVTDDEDRIAFISPWPRKQAGCPGFEYFPASHLFARAHRVITGAGYNAMAEMTGHSDKHIAIPF